MLYDLHIFSKYVITLKFCQDLVIFCVQFWYEYMSTLIVLSFHIFNS